MPIVIAGELMLHSACRVDSIPRPNQHLLVDGVSLGLAGPALNMARNLVNLEREVVLTGPAGRADRLQLQQEGPGAGVERGMVWLEGHSDLLFTWRTGDGYASLYQRAELGPAHVEALEATARGARLLVLTGSRHHLVRDAYVRLVESSGSTIVFAPNYALDTFDAKTLEQIFSAAAVTALNETETALACDLLGCVDERALSAKTGGLLIVTRAKDGAEVFVTPGMQPIAVPSSSGRDDDVFGAGDAFLSAFLDARFEQGFDPREAGLWAGEMAGLFVQRKQGEADLPVVERASIDAAYRARLEALRE